MDGKKLRRRDDDDSGDDPAPHHLRKATRSYDTATTIGVMIIEISGDGTEAGAVETETFVANLSRQHATEELTSSLNRKTVFSYESGTGTVNTEPLTAEPNRQGATEEPTPSLNGKIVFIYESDARRESPGWMVAMDEDICALKALGNTLFVSENGRELRDAATAAGASECRWVSVTERELREQNLW